LSEDYDRFSVPKDPTNMPHDVKLGISVFSISNIDMREGIFDLEMWLQLSWQDERMRACQCQDRGNRKIIKLSGELAQDIWIPDLKVLNLVNVEKEVGISKTGGIRLVTHESNAGVLYDIRVQTLIDCNFIASWFPFDNNVCVLRIASDLHPVNEMFLTMDKLPELKKSKGSGFTFTIDWLSDDETRLLPLSRYSSGDFQCVGFRIGFKRDGQSTIYQYTAIMGVMVIMTTLTIILPNDSVDRLGPIGVILVGALTVYYTVSLDFPRPVGGVSPLVIYVLTGLAICYFSLLEFVVLLKFRRQPGNMWVDRLDKTFLVVGLITWVCMTVVVWVLGKDMAGHCGEEECYHNLD